MTPLKKNSSCSATDHRAGNRMFRNEPKSVCLLSLPNILYTLGVYVNAREVRYGNLVLSTIILQLFIFGTINYLRILGLQRGRFCRDAIYKLLILLDTCVTRSIVSQYGNTDPHFNVWSYNEHAVKKIY